MELPNDSSDKGSVYNSGDAGDVASIPGLGRSPGGGNGNPFQYSCLGNPIDRGAWRAAIHGVAKSQTTITFPVCPGFPIFGTLWHIFACSFSNVLTFVSIIKTFHLQPVFINVKI